MATKKKSTRSSGPLLDPDVLFPSCKEFEHPKKLPTVKSIVSCLKYLTNKKYTHEQAIREVAKRVFAKYYHDTVCCLSLRGIEKRVEGIWDTFREGRRRVREGRTTGKAIDSYKEIASKIDALFDVSVVSR